MSETAEVLAFWFDELTPEQRFKRDDAVDAEIARFGRYPARHQALGRTMTPEAAALLAANPMGF